MHKIGETNNNLGFGSFELEVRPFLKEKYGFLITDEKFHY